MRGKSSQEGNLLLNKNRGGEISCNSSHRDQEERGLSLSRKWKGEIETKRTIAAGSQRKGWDFTIKERGRNPYRGRRYRLPTVRGVLWDKRELSALEGMGGEKPLRKIKKKKGGVLPLDGVVWKKSDFIGGEYTRVEKGGSIPTCVGERTSKKGELTYILERGHQREKLFSKKKKIEIREEVGAT